LSRFLRPVEHRFTTFPDFSYSLRRKILGSSAVLAAFATMGATAPVGSLSTGGAAMRRFIMLVAMAALMVALLLPAGAASAQQADTVKVKVGPTAKLLDDGRAVQVEVRVKCGPPAEVLEALVTVSQDEGAAFGEAGITSVVCDGKKRTHRVTVEALDSTFRRGEAFECVETAQGQDSREVRVVGS
jgi:hypothetical protein